jgi:hypothetical protein
MGPTPGTTSPTTKFCCCGSSRGVFPRESFSGEIGCRGERLCGDWPRGDISLLLALRKLGFAFANVSGGIARRVTIVASLLKTKNLSDLIFYWGEKSGYLRWGSGFGSCDRNDASATRRYGHSRRPECDLLFERSERRGNRKLACLTFLLPEVRTEEE